MSTTSRRHTTTTTRQSGSRAPDMFQNLEPRQLLSADHGVAVHGPIDTGAAMVEWGNSEVPAIRGQWLVSYERAASQKKATYWAKKLVRELGLSAGTVRPLHSGRHAVISGVQGITPEAVEELKDEFSWLKEFVPDLIYKNTAVPNDPFFPDQWQNENSGQNVPGSGPGTIGADANLPDAWNLTTGSRTVIVGVIDSGVDMQHPDLIANIWRNTGEVAGNGIDDDGNGFVDDINGWDFGELDNDPDDVVGHGTSVAGTIGAVGDNNLGVSGVAWNVSIIPVKIADRFGQPTASAAVAAHEYLTLMIGEGHNIVASNNSYGFFGDVLYANFENGIEAEREAIEDFIAAGGSFVVAAGNDGEDNDIEGNATYPAAYNIPGSIVVASSNNVDALSDFSNYGDERVDLAAPGEQIFTTMDGGGYGYVSGTSFSAPMVVGAIALMKTLRPDVSRDEIRQILIDSSDPLPSLQGRVRSGGRLNVARALEIIGIDGPTTIAFDPGPVAGQNRPDGSRLDSVIVTFSKDMDESSFSTDGVTLLRAGPDREFGTGDDSLVTVTSVVLVDGNRTVEINLDVSGFAQQRLPTGLYRLTLDNADFLDTDGNRLNGNQVAGEDEVYGFEVVAVSGTFEPNDTIATATPSSFSGSGTATYQGLTIGDGLAGALDVDIFAVTLPRGGLIRASVLAAQLPLPSGFDSYLRLFNALGEELTANDQFNGPDALIDFFVTTGGTYYIGVSGFPNDDYDPTLQGSGAAQDTGIYNLTVEVELVNNDRVTYAASIPEPIRIPAEGTIGQAVPSVINIADARAVRDVNVRLNIQHEFVGDLEIFLISPGGTQVRLINQRGGSNSQGLNNVVFDDEAVRQIATATTPFTGSYRPEQSLSAIDGQDADGAWRLIINDRLGIHTGQLIAWSLDLTLENNIFGPFELNDTTATATPLNNIDGTGSQSVQAVIGDGGFGLLDRDLFSFEANAGTTLNIDVTSSGVLNSAIRLFDATGQELTLISPSGSRNASLENFIVNEAGTYYVGVSEGANIQYSPLQVAGGTPSASTGEYSLAVSVAPGIGDTARVLDGSGLEVGVSNDGTFLADRTVGGQTQQVGMRFNGIEFLFDSDGSVNPDTFFGLSAAGYTARNDGAGGDPTGLPVFLTDESDSANRRLVSAGAFRGLNITRTISFADGDNFAAIDVILTNNTGARIDDLSWMEGFNPQQGLNVAGGSASTRNTVVGFDSDNNGIKDIFDPIATANFVNNIFPNGLTVALAAAQADGLDYGGRAQASVVGATDNVRDPSILLDAGVSDPDGATGDGVLTLAYDLGNLDAGGSTRMRYFVFFGEGEQDVLDLYDQVNSGDGTGHLAAIDENGRLQVANDQLEVVQGQRNTAPALPYQLFYPEGYAGPETTTFIPVVNPNSTATRVVIIARYQSGARDQVIFDQVLAPNARGGLQVTSPERYENSQNNASGPKSRVRIDTPYALELRSEQPVAATFSHYDNFLAAEANAAIGESFINRQSTEWSFAQAKKGPGESDFLLIQNTSDRFQKVTFTFVPTGGGEVYTFTRSVDVDRRNGISLQGLTALPEGTYGVLVVGQDDLIATLSHYSANTQDAYGVTGTVGRGGTIGATPEGEIGLNATVENIGIANFSGTATSVRFSFIFESGTTYRTRVNVPSLGRTELRVQDLPNFPTGEPYAVLYESDQPVVMTLPTQVFNEANGSNFSDTAYTRWSFAEGYRPASGQGIESYLRLFNPNSEDVLVEITMHFPPSGNQAGAAETFRRTIGGRSVIAVNLHDLVTGARRQTDQYYGVTIKAGSTIVAYQGHFDRGFGGSFGTLGTPLGITNQIT